MQIDEIMQQSAKAFELYKTTTPSARAAFLEAIASEITRQREVLVQTAGEETNLPAARLDGEINRTAGQLQLFANLIREGSWVDAVIDTAKPDAVPAKPDIRRMLLPVGPVVVFGASNFPFAFSTAGGDTASALAAGATVVIKAHPAHKRTSEKVFAAIQKAIQQSGMPEHTVQHVAATGNSVGKELVMHPVTTGVGFTGSFRGGTALSSYAAQREIPIPVFAEMSSINPVVFYPHALEEQATQLSKTFAASVTLGAGQFCTNPGLLIALQSDALENFLQLLGDAIAASVPQKMLHNGIHEAYIHSREQLISQEGVTLVSQSKVPGALEGQPVLLRTTGNTFLANPLLKEEVFGPGSLMVVCSDKTELQDVLKSIKGQLTTTVIATEEDTATWQDVIALQATLAGRIILNNPPTGVEVCAAMVHGGPYPATTDARFTSVGSSAIKRWVRPVCFQNFPDHLLPDALKQANPQGIWRQIDNRFTR